MTKSEHVPAPKYAVMPDIKDRLREHAYALVLGLKSPGARAAHRTMARPRPTTGTHSDHPEEGSSPAQVEATMFLVDLLDSALARIEVLEALVDVDVHQHD